MNASTLLSSPPRPSSIPAGDGHDGDHLNSQRRSHLTKFAFLLSSARGEGSDEPVVGFNHDVEMAACFSSRHLAGGGGPVITPPSISSSSLSMHQGKNGPTRQPQSAIQAESPKKSLLDAVALNMSTPFFTTPDTASSTAKTVLKNLVTAMEELMDSRLRSTISHLVRKGGISNSHMLFRLLSPSRRPIQVATVITRFVLPDGEGDTTHCSTSMDDMVSIPLLFKATMHVKVFGEASVIVLTCPVTMSGKFDGHDGLLNAVNVCFDCVNLLQAIIGQARLVVKLAVTKAAALSVQIAKWYAAKKCDVQSMMSLMSLSLYSLLGSSASLNSLGTLDAPELNNLFTSFSSLSNANSNMSAKQKRVKAGKSVLRKSSYGYLRGYSRSDVNAILAKRNRLDNFPASTTANATFDLVSGLNNNAVGVATNTASVVRFQSPTTSPNYNSQANHRLSQQSSASTLTCSSSQPPQALQIEVQTSQRPRQEESQQVTNGIIHTGLFSWLQNDSMLLTDAKIKEQNAADAEHERLQRDAPMPLRFFTAADDMGGGQRGLEMVSKSIFGGALEQQRQEREWEREPMAAGSGSE